MRTGIVTVAIVAGFTLALTGVALAQKTPLMGNPTTPPPMHKPMPSLPHISPNILHAPPAEAIVPSPNYTPPAAVPHPLPPCHPYNCEQLATIEEGRKRMRECLSLTRKGGPEGHDPQELDECMLGFMAPSRVDKFWDCIDAVTSDAMTCFSEAYLQ